MDKNYQLLKYLFEFITPDRTQKIKQIVEERTRYLTVVLEDLYQPHNASAVIRSCDCFGIQDLHIIENKYEFSVSEKVVQGSSKWIDIHNYNEKEQNTLSTLNELKEKGYRIVATSPHANDVTLDELNVEKGKIALVFGTEQHGISDVVKENADEFVRIPMYGFTESFNISVSAALCLQSITNKIRNSDANWRLTEDEKELLKLDWARNTIRNSEIIEKEFLSSLP